LLGNVIKDKTYLVDRFSSYALEKADGQKVNSFKEGRKLI
jgi:hypothetical protein